MFDQTHKTLALEFARALADRDYATALAMCSADLAADLNVDALRREFEEIVPTDWGRIDPIEIEDIEDLPFIYVVLGGDVYSEALMIESFAEDDGLLRVDAFELGRP